VHHETHEQMKEMDVELVLERAKEKNPGMRPRIIVLPQLEMDFV